ncbi:pyridoxamine 5'-phosphate oxidase family protein [Actinomadura violacea]|uniref:Pyridoxamine 5'-phosphate oxidase family protein n=1 Tax=Actinomadura violacea TaxID=2819934 RepID=A0ABS3RV89_9ACTN|nr:pyridoxamine 5'-phosphate oxidase family protein [Actinomadura violacea]MBO2460665.1 pyridoxamine 5'-phosphate oxidase family protein [Actinomadura violacea]
MATWRQFEEEAAELAATVKERFEAAETHVLATMRLDGSPRVSGSEVDFKGADLSFGSMLGAVKARDLQRDGRCAIHAHPADPEHGGDAKVAGVAVEITDPEEKKAYTTGGEPPGDFHAFRLDLREAVLTSVEDGRLVIRVWRPGAGVRTVSRT